MKLDILKHKIILHVKCLLSFANAILVVTIISSVLSFYFSFYSSVHSVDQIMTGTLGQVSITLTGDIELFLIKVDTFVHFTQVAVAQGDFQTKSGINDLLTLQKHLWLVFDSGKDFSMTSYYICDAVNCIGYASQPPCAIVQFDGVTPNHTLYLVPIWGDAGHFNYSDLPDNAFLETYYDSETSTPYKYARDTGLPIWGDLYIFDPQLPEYVYLTFYQPIFYPNGSFCAVANVDLTTNSFDEYLKELPFVVGGKGAVMLLDTDGYLIASSVPNQTALVFNPNATNYGDKIKGTDVKSPELAAGAKYLLEKYDLTTNDYVNKTAQIHTPIGKYFIQASIINVTGNKTWVLITMQPRSFYFNRIDNTRHLIIAFSCVSLAAGFLYRVLPFVKQLRARRRIADIESNTTSTVSFAARDTLDTNSSNSDE